MTITLTTDAILDVSDVKELLDLDNTTKANVLINSVSRKFLNFTGRTYINQADAAVTELSRGDGTRVIWLRAYATGVASVEILSDGVASSTYTATDYAVDADGPKVTLYNAEAPRSDDEENVRVTYVPGWPVIPGDIITGALDQIIRERDRMAGRQVGMTSETRGAATATYETGGLLKSVMDAWQPYKIMR